MKSILLIIPVFLVLISCKKEKLLYNIPCDHPTSELDASKSLIVGRWTWVSEYWVSPFTGNIVIRTPQSEGYTRQLIYSKSLTSQFYKNHQAIDDKTYYDIVEERTITNYPTDMQNVLKYNKYPSGTYLGYVHFKICNDTLIFNFQISSDVAGQEKWVRSFR